MVLIEINPNRIRRIKVNAKLGELLLRKNHYSKNGRYLAENEFSRYFAPAEMPKSEPVPIEAKDVPLEELSGLAPYVNEPNAYIEAQKPAESDKTPETVQEEPKPKRTRAPRKAKD